LAADAEGRLVALTEEPLVAEAAQAVLTAKLAVSWVAALVEAGLAVSVAATA
jgi:hypothetical protein